jgi:integrase/recombinase XerD
MKTTKSGKIRFNLELNSRPQKNKSHSILLRVSCNGKRFRISTGQSVNQLHFNPNAKYGSWITKALNSNAINSELGNYLSEANNNVKKLIAFNLAPTIQEIKEAIIRDENAKVEAEESPSFIKFFEEKLKQSEVLNSVNYSKNLRSKLEKLKGYLDGHDLLFSELTVKFLNEYKVYLVREGNSRNTVISNFKDIRTIFNKAYEENHYQGYYPFKNFKVGVMKSEKAALDLKDIEKIKLLELEEESSVWHTRNYFLFALLVAGIRIGDLMQLTWANVKDSRLVYSRSKTGTGISIKLVPYAVEILSHYRHAKSKPNEYIFPILNNGVRKADRVTLNKQIASKTAMVNKDLKRIQRRAEIDTKITTHISRHSYASMLRADGVDTYDIKNLLGHSSVAVTENYLNQLDPLASDGGHENSMNKV